MGEKLIPMVELQTNNYAGSNGRGIGGTKKGKGMCGYIKHPFYPRQIETQVDMCSVAPKRI